MSNLAPIYAALLPFNEAINAFEKKRLIPSTRWDELQGYIHARAFTVAGATELALLADFKAAVAQSIKEGQTLAQFRKSFDAIVSKHGWSYNGARGWRSQVIYQNNRNTARAAGRWEQFQQTKQTRPYLMYLTAGDSRVRLEHAKWNRIIAHIDDAFWLSHYTPNGWGCRCNVISLSYQQMQSRGLMPASREHLDQLAEPREVVNAETGEVTIQREGLDQGWDYNTGVKWIGADVQIGKQLAALDVDVRDAAIHAINAGQQSGKAFVINTFISQPKHLALAVGHINSEAVLKSGATSTLVLIDDRVSIVGDRKTALDIAWRAVHLHAIESASSELVRWEYLGKTITAEFKNGAWLIMSIE